MLYGDKKYPDIITGEVEPSSNKKGLEITDDDGSEVSEITSSTTKSKTSAEIIKDSMNAIKTSSFQSFTYLPERLVKKVNKNWDAINPKMELFKHM
eukprot:2179421-Ditylum_brightwellii.AAC.1